MEHTLKKFAFWLQFFGIITIIGGAISAIGGLVFLLIGAIPGIIVIWLGWKLVKAAQHCKTLEYNIDTANKDELVEHMMIELTTYFKINTIITLIVPVLGILLFIFGLVSMINYGINY